MAITFATLKTNLYTWAVANIPAMTPVLYYNQDAPRPSKPYITLFLRDFIQIGWDYVPKPDALGDAEIIGNREFTLQIESYGTNSMQVLENLRSALQNPNVLDTLRANNIVFVNQFPINDTTILLDTQYEERATMDVLFRIANTIEPNIGLIEIVEVEEILSNGESIVYDETLIIDAS